jgi:hypothetical protein
MGNGECRSSQLLTALLGLPGIESIVCGASLPEFIEKVYFGLQQSVIEVEAAVVNVQRVC